MLSSKTKICWGWEREKKSSRKDKQDNDIGDGTNCDEDSEDYYKDCPTEADRMAKCICGYLNNYVINIQNEWKWTCIDDKSGKKIVITQGESKAEIFEDFDELEKLGLSASYYKFRIKIIDNKNWKYGKNLHTIGELKEKIKQLNYG